MPVLISPEMSVREQVARAIAAVMSPAGLESHISDWSPKEQAARAAVLRAGGDFARAREAVWNVRTARAADRVLALLDGAGTRNALELESSAVTDRVADEHRIVDHHFEPHCVSCGATPDRPREEHGHWERRHVAEATAAALALTRPVELREVS